MTDEYLVLGAEDETVFETIYSGTKEECYIEFDVLMNDEEAKKQYILIAVVKNILVANLDYNVSEYPEESEKTNVVALFPNGSVEDEPTAISNSTCAKFGHC